MSHAGLPERLRVIDSHTIGEPTRVVIDDSLVAGLDLGGGSVRERRDLFRERYDHIRRALVGDPRGAVAMVGVILLPPTDPSCRFGAFYVNRVGYLDICGHATIGLAVTLGHLSRIEPGSFRLETPAGVVGVSWHGGGEASFECVPPRRIKRTPRIGVDYAGDWAKKPLRFVVDPRRLPTITQPGREPS
jgi:proline racemase